jgi:hypothetical protein
MPRRNNGGFEFGTLSARQTRDWQSWRGGWKPALA